MDLTLPYGLRIDRRSWRSPAILGRATGWAASVVVLQHLIVSAADPRQQGVILAIVLAILMPKADSTHLGLLQLQCALGSGRVYCRTDSRPSHPPQAG